MTANETPGLFEAVGIELEYMLVRRDTLDVAPVADALLDAAGGAVDGEVERGPVTWSNELVLHVVEFKTNGPAPSLAGLAEEFNRAARDADSLLAPLGARLMPTAMHPWIDPFTETRLWSREYSKVYETYNRIFDCRGHGWANLQSAHINLPFRDDAEFARLHAAVRLLLPILPALAASSPFADGRARSHLDFRLCSYFSNSDAVPSVAGRVVPEPLFSKRDYETKLLEKIYADIAPLDPEGVLRHEWLNSRGAIARFDRNAIEIRLLDVQECPAADISIAALAIETLKALVAERHVPFDEQIMFETAPLADILLDAARDADAAVIRDARYLAAMGAPGERSLEARELWSALLDNARAAVPGDSLPLLEPAAFIVKNGVLARRILAAAGRAPSRDRLREVYLGLCRSLSEGTLFDSESV